MASGESKEIQSPRQLMIEAAVKFLQNPQIQNSSLLQKRAFLSKKGLTEEEIELAVQKANEENTSFTSHHLPVSSTVQHQSSVWKHMYRTGSTFLFFGMTIYSLRQFYKLYLEPWLYGAERKTYLNKLEEQVLEVNRSLAELQKTVSAMDATMKMQKEEMNNCLKTLKSDQELMVNPITFSEVQAEIATIKSLLLNRHQFPDAPKLYHGIPSWQLASNSNEKDVKSQDEIEMGTSENIVVKNSHSNQNNAQLKNDDNEVSTENSVHKENNENESENDGEQYPVFAAEKNKSSQLELEVNTEEESLIETNCKDSSINSHVIVGSS